MPWVNGFCVVEYYDNRAFQERMGPSLLLRSSSKIGIRNKTCATQPGEERGGFAIVEKFAFGKR